jgi:toxin ParE1/3/4
MKYLISNEATNDLEKIWLYTYENWSLEQADRYINLIFDEIEFLSKNPKLGKDYSHVREGYFCSSVKSHLIFYRMNINNDAIEVVRILHQQMDIESRLNK